MSLPGAATEKEDSALFEVLSRNVGSRENSPVKELKDTTDTSQIHEIESHLIENLSEPDKDKHSTSYSGVEIDELPPADDELEKNSQIESETSPKTVIQVEPAAPKILQSVEVQLEPYSFGVATIILDNEIQDSLESPALVNQLIKTNKHFEKTNNEKVIDEEVGSQVINEIPDAKSLTEDRKEEILLEVSDSEIKDIEDKSVKEHLSIDINGLPLPSTPLEEEEKKRFLDSIPHLENNSDSIAVSKQAKKEYYQSLRKYLIHEEENKPPVPLQTYRWEDLRRAKEKVRLFFLNYEIVDLDFVMIIHAK